MNEQSKILDFYVKNINPLPSKYEIDLIFSYLDDMEEDLIIKAMEIAKEKNKKYTKYIIGILNNFINNNIKTIKDYKAKNEGRNGTYNRTNSETGVKKSFSRNYGTTI